MWITLPTYKLQNISANQRKGKIYHSVKVRKLKTLNAYLSKNAKKKIPAKKKGFTVQYSLANSNTANSKTSQIEEFRSYQIFLCLCI